MSRITRSQTAAEMQIGTIEERSIDVAADGCAVEVVEVHADKAAMRELPSLRLREWTKHWAHALR